MNIPIEIFLHITDSLSFTEKVRMNRLNRKTCAAINSRLEQDAIKTLTDSSKLMTEEKVNEAVRFLIVHGKKKEAFVLLRQALSNEAAILKETLFENTEEKFDVTTTSLVLDSSHSDNIHLQRYTHLKNALITFYGIAGLYENGQAFSLHEEFLRLIGYIAIDYITKKNLNSESIELIKYWKTIQFENEGYFHIQENQWKNINLVKSTDISFSATYLSTKNPQAFTGGSEIETAAYKFAQDLLEQAGIPVNEPMKWQDTGKDGFFMDNNDETSSAIDEDDFGSDRDDTASQMETDSELDKNEIGSDDDNYMRLT